MKKVSHPTKVSALRYRKIDYRSEITESWDNDHYGIERIPHSFNGSREFEFLKQLDTLLPYVDNGFVHNVVKRWISLVQLDTEFDPLNFIPFFPKLAFIRRFNLPRVERDMKRVFSNIFNQYRWLPDSLSIKASDVFLQDKKVIRNYAKPKPWKVSRLDPRRLLRAMDLMTRVVDFNVHARVRTVDEYIEDMNKHSSACYPTYLQKSDLTAQHVMREFVSEVMSKDSMMGILSSIFSQAVTVFHRFSPKVKSKIRSVETKIRLVFGYPFGILALQEMIHGDAIQKVVEKLPFTVAQTRIKISELVSRIRYSAAQLGCNLIQYDIQGMDYRLSSLSVLLSHAIMIEMNRLSGCVQDDTHLAKIEECIALYELRTPIIGSWGSTVISNGGTKSGTRFNTFANSISILLATIYHNLGNDRIDYYSMTAILTILAQSDDALGLSSQKDTIDDWCDTFKDFNMTIHPEKSVISRPIDDLDYLGMTWDIVNAPHRGFDWIASKLIYPERYLDVPFKERFLLRATSILCQIANGIPIYLRLLSTFDRSLSDRLKQGKRTEVPLYKYSDLEPAVMTLPFDKVMMIGWRLF